MTEIEFPMYFSLVPTPGYNISYLETCNIGGEWELFHGWWTGSEWSWGGNCSFEGKRRKNTFVFSNIFVIRYFGLWKTGYVGDL